MYPEGSFFDSLFRDHPCITISMSKDTLVVLDHKFGHLRPPLKGAAGYLGEPGYDDYLCKLAETIKELM